ncbi:hypothetical protein [Tenacibaculum ovolyticum]|uniref:hypothetical protein n=1 Tax=Tenacibaculum ovolyticum TaxID=104270 RepID=UPI0004008D44|nr:hypothetical protein [Tenacibaculum ovolyticum]
MKKTKSYILSLVIILTLSCKNKSKIETKKNIDLDLKKTSELITQILIDKNDSYLSSSCISESRKPFTSSNFFDIVEKANQYLNIKDSLHLKNQADFFNDFKIIKRATLNKKVITEKQYNELKSKRKFWKWIEINCEKGYCSISKPIFNETYDLACIQIYQKLFSFDFSSEIIIYEYKIENGVKKKQ